MDGNPQLPGGNFLRDKVKSGDQILFYHSSCKPTAIVGVAQVVGPPYSDPLALDKNSPYYFSKATPENNPWVCLDIEALYPLKRQIRLTEIKANSKLEKMFLVQKGSRLAFNLCAKKNLNSLFNWNVHEWPPSANLVDLFNQGKTRTDFLTEARKKLTPLGSYGLALAQLRQGFWIEGWINHEARLKAPSLENKSTLSSGFPKHSKKLFTIVLKKTLGTPLLIAEQGLEIHF